jgi:hypothetical protein
MGKFIITEEERRYIKSLYEQTSETFDSSVFCDENVTTPLEQSVKEKFNKMNQTEKQKLIGTIGTKFKQDLSKAKNEYVAWFRNPDTIKKFPSLKDKLTLSKVDEFLKKINNLNILLTTPENKSDGTTAWVSGDDLSKINIILPHFYDGEKWTNKESYIVIKHEMGHLIDFFFKKNGLKTYKDTVDTSTAELYKQNYIVNDMDQYTRLNVLRGIIDAGPMDDAKTLIDKFTSKIKEGVIVFPGLSVSVVSSGTPTKKNDTNAANSFGAWFTKHGGILVNGKDVYNITQLFSNFAAKSNDSVVVNFNLISQLNIDSAKVDKPSSSIPGGSELAEQTQNNGIVYYLKLTPKKQVQQKVTS